MGVPDAALIPLWRRGLPGLVTDLTPARMDEERLQSRLAELRDLMESAAAEIPQDIPGIESLRGWEKGLLAAVEHLAVLRRSFESEPSASISNCTSREAKTSEKTRPLPSGVKAMPLGMR